ncbi:MAG: UDP-N-acetylmuramoyl-L-alanyl-D-glutamate--2,6-diaminopimelate ligase [Bacteroidia bacterium]|nr:UDP-N-acetylmuramoyl-L-alanyl-D-glutamate--2,6-diaminopimelate ligase [Bacteroidia bacterium]
MKLLSEILYGCPILRVQGDTHLAISGVSIHTYHVKKDFLFIAIRGTKTDAHQFIPTAIEQGAVAIICEYWPDQIPENITVIQVSDTRKAAGICASNFYDNPSSKLKLVGVTGTNGKTTTVTLLHYVFQQAFGSAGLISTVVNKIKNKEYPSALTTPDPVSLQEMLHEMVKEGCTHAFMEVSSIAVDQKRIEGINFTGAVFTNLTHDHLDYHGTFENYRDAKKKFFDSIGKHAFALTNKDDKNGLYMLQNCNAKHFTYGLKHQADFMCKILEKDFEGMHLRINSKEFYTRLTGTFNAYNLTAVFAVCVILGFDEQQTLTILSLAEPVRGRFQYYRTSDGVTGVVDYAHTPDALENVLNTIHDIAVKNEKIITVVGCGGNRDTAKRSLMAEIACRLSHKVILTSDNPRDEDPKEIIRQMQEGVPPNMKSNVVCITDRKEAILAAKQMAAPGDIVLIAGKGHETYQEIKGIKYPFDDMEIWKETDKQTLK